jgi:hypothetical protein
MEATIAGLVQHTALGKTIAEAYGLCKTVIETHRNIVGGSQVQKALEKMDVQAQLEAAGSLVCTLSRTHNLDQTETGALLCSQLRDAIDRVQSDLREISEESQLHQTRWFSGWRYANYGPLLKKLGQSKLLMETRLQRLTQIAPLLAAQPLVKDTKIDTDAMAYNDEQIDKLISELEQAFLCSKTL